MPKDPPTGATAAANLHRGVEDRAFNIQLWGEVGGRGRVVVRGRAKGRGRGRTVRSTFSYVARLGVGVVGVVVVVVVGTGPCDQDTLDA